MHEIYIAEKIVQEIIKKAEQNKAKKVLVARIAIPQDEHFTEEDFKKILEIQSRDPILKKTAFKVKKESTDKIYIKDIKIE